MVRGARQHDADAGGVQLPPPLLDCRGGAVGGGADRVLRDRDPGPVRGHPRGRPPGVPPRRRPEPARHLLRDLDHGGGGHRLAHASRPSSGRVCRAAGRAGPHLLQRRLPRPAGRGHGEPRRLVGSPLRAGAHHRPGRRRRRPAGYRNVGPRRDLDAPGPRPGQRTAVPGELARAQRPEHGRARPAQPGSGRALRRGRPAGLGAPGHQVRAGGSAGAVRQRGARRLHRGRGRAGPPRRRWPPGPDRGCRAAGRSAIRHTAPLVGAVVGMGVFATNEQVLHFRQLWGLFAVVAAYPLWAAAPRALLAAARLSRTRA